VDDMRAVVYDEADGDDEVDAGDHVDGEAPEVHEAPNVNQCYENAQENEETPLEAGDEEQGHQEHTQQGQPQVLVKFLPNNLICLPTRILSAGREGSGAEVCITDQALDLVHGRNPFRWGSEELVSQLDGG